MIEFQTDEAVAPAIAATLSGGGHPARSPSTFPIPARPTSGRTTIRRACSPDAISAGGRRAGGTGEVDEILLLELARAGSLVRARSSGVPAGHHRDAARRRQAARSSHRRRRAVQDVAREGAPASARVEGQSHPGRRGQRFERAGRRARLSGGGPRRALRDCRAERRAGRPRRAARARARRSSRRSPIFRSATARISSGSPRHPDDAGRAARRVRAPSGDHADNVDHFYPNDALLGVTMYAGY